ncbi:MAG TPA: glycine zipper domain-containing protein, partial [Aquabacterium sp.]|nr:glycine zipper domain-containing protein [Aquabacterium sp.]
MSIPPTLEKHIMNTPARGTRLLTLSTLAAALLAGCANMNDTERRTATGAAIGAVAGAVLSEVTGNDAGTGAVVGGVAGAVIGNVWSRRLEEQKKTME